jgi:diguanylate cyclase
MTHSIATRPDGPSNRSVGERAWDVLHEHRIPPTPCSFAVFYTLLDGSNPRLEQHFRRLAAGGGRVTLQDIEALHSAYIDGRDDAAEVAAGADDLAEVAQGIVEQVSRGSDALRAYGGALDHWRDRLDTGTDAEALVRAVEALTIETERASARNSELEARLSAEVDRVARLRQDLIQVRQDAATDPLTGIPNRRVFDAKLRRALKNAEADPSSRFTLLMLDVDHFKHFNDRHGHKTGDQVLRLVARSVADNVKGRDTASRFGGEEFAVLLIGANLAVATTVAQQMCDRLARQRLIKRGSGEPIGQITISIGVAEHHPGDTDADLIGRADAALYEAKRTGRNRVCTWTTAISAA